MKLHMEFKSLPRGMDVVLGGELNFVDAQMFMQKVPAMTEGRGERVRLQMKGLSFIDSSGLGAMLYVSEALRMRGQILEVVNAGDNIKSLLKSIHNLGTFIIVVQTLK